LIGRLDVEERRLPVFAGLDDVGAGIFYLAGCGKTTAAVGHISRIGGFAAFDGGGNDLSCSSIVGSEVEEALEERDARSAAEIALAECHEPGKVHDEVGGEMMRLKSVELKELAEEGACGKAESTLKVSEEDDPLARARAGHDVGLARDPPFDLCGHLSGANQCFDGDGGGLGSLPAPAARLRDVPSWRHWFRRRGRRGSRPRRSARTTPANCCGGGGGGEERESVAGAGGRAEVRGREICARSGNGAEREGKLEVEGDVR
jgi:hypothetical protein